MDRWNSSSKYLDIVHDSFHGEYFLGVCETPEAA